MLDFMAFTKLQLLRFALVSILLTVAKAEYYIHEKAGDELGSSASRSRAKRDTVLPIRIALRPNEHASAKAEEWLMAVSDPDSVNYGQFWTQDQVLDTFKPADETVGLVKNWLSDHGIADPTHSDNKQWLAFDLTVREAEAMLKTEYYESLSDSGRVEVSCDRYMLPEALREHVDFVKPGIMKSNFAKRSLRNKQVKRDVNTANEQQGHVKTFPPPFPKHPPADPDSLERCDREVTPACVRALYNIPLPNPDEPVCASNSLGIFEEGDLYYQGDLDSLYSQLTTNIPNGTSPIEARIDGGELPPDAPRTRGWRNVGGEAELDLESALPIIYPQNATIYQTDDVYYALAVDYAKHGLMLFNDFLDAIDGSYCTYSAFGETGNSPKHDPKYPDPHPHGYKGKLQCGVFKPTNVISISWGGGEGLGPYNYMERQCNEYLKLALQGVSIFIASGDSGSECGHVPFHSFRRLYGVSGIGGCPWVTAVGGTQISKGHTVHQREQAAKESWAGISSGGGFSMVHDAPQYQKAAIERYFEVSNNASDIPYFFNGKYKGNDGLYNRNGRGVPDISAVSANLAGYTRNQYGGSSGTSASAPLVAAMFNRIIEERIRAGKKGPLGLVNPTLYKNPQLLNDILEGHNGECSGSRYYLHIGPDLGYNCTEGWDPVTGLGTPKYPELLKLFMGLP